MGFSLPPVPTLVAFALVAVALLFQIIGVAANGWVVSGAVKLGLWKYCLERAGASACVDIDENTGLEDYLKAVRAFGLLGIFVMAGSAVCGLLVCFLRNQQQILSLGAAFTACLGAVFSLIEWAIFVGKSPEGYRDYLDYSFGLTVTATILCLVATVLFILGRNKNSVS